MLTISSQVIFPLCLIFFLLLFVSWWFFEGFDDQDKGKGTTSIWVCLFWIVNFTVILRPIQSPVALAISSQTVFGDRPRGPILGPRADMAPTSPLVHLRYMTLISLGLNFNSMMEAAGVRWTRIQVHRTKLHFGLLRAKSYHCFFLFWFVLCYWIVVNYMDKPWENLLILLLKDVWIVSSFCLLWIGCYKLSYTSLFVNVCFSFSAKYLRVKLLIIGYMCV